jgi:hypothetical protein
LEHSKCSWVEDFKQWRVRREFGEGTEGLEAALAELVAGGAASGPGTAAAAAVTAAGAATTVAPAARVVAPAATMAAPAATMVAPAATMVAPAAAVASAATPRVSVVIRRPRRTPTPESFPSRDGIEILEAEPPGARAQKRRRVEKGRALEDPREVSEALNGELHGGYVSP